MAFLVDLSIALHIGSIFLSLMLAVSIVKRNSYYKKANYYILYMLLGTMAINANAALILSDNAEYYFYTQHISNVGILLIGPSMYLAIIGRLGSGLGKKQISKHYTPFFVYAGFVLYGFTGPKAGALLDQSESIAFLIFIVQIPLYIGLVFKEIKGENKELFKGIRLLLWALLTTYLVQLGVVAYEVSVAPLLDAVTLNVSLLISLGIIALAYRCFGNEKVLFDSPKYAASSLSGDQSEELINRLKKLMEEEQLYLSAELKIAEVADKLGVNSKQLSQAINHSLEQKFNDFVNAYRVTYVAALLQDPAHEHFTLLAVAELGGFKSGSVFNAAFKKHKGMLPSAYRKEYLKGAKD